MHLQISGNILQVASPHLFAMDTAVAVDELADDQQQMPTNHPSNGMTDSLSVDGSNDASGLGLMASAVCSSNATMFPTPKTPIARSKSGYILFSAEVRKRVMNDNPEATFGEISRLVGEEWKKLAKADKEAYELRAISKANELIQKDLTEPSNKLLPGQAVVHQCKWAQCEQQHDSKEVLLEHVAGVHLNACVGGLIRQLHWRLYEFSRRRPPVPVPMVHVRQIPQGGPALPQSGPPAAAHQGETHAQRAQDGHGGQSGEVSGRQFRIAIR